eukprot:Nk52_evm78s208 gene=Nk52_evmTU78s208
MSTNTCNTNSHSSSPSSSSSSSSSSASSPGTRHVQAALLHQQQLSLVVEEVVSAVRHRDVHKLARIFAAATCYRDRTGAGDGDNDNEDEDERLPARGNDNNGGLSMMATHMEMEMEMDGGGDKAHNKHGLVLNCNCSATPSASSSSSTSGSNGSDSVATRAGSKVNIKDSDGGSGAADVSPPSPPSSPSCQEDSEDESASGKRQGRRLVNENDQDTESEQGGSLYKANETTNKMCLKDLLNARDKNGNTPLHVAVEQDYVDIASFLLQHGADPNTHNYRIGTPLHTAAYFGRLQCIDMLVHFKASVQARGYCNRSPAHWAAARGNTECLRLLFDSGAIINARDSYDITPTHLAAEHGHFEVLKLLLDRGAKVNLKDDYGWTPAHWAAGRGYVKCLRVLVARDHLICQQSPPAPPPTTNTLLHYNSTNSNNHHHHSSNHQNHSHHHHNHYHPSSSGLMRKEKEHMVGGAPNDQVGTVAPSSPPASAASSSSSSSPASSPGSMSLSTSPSSSSPPHQHRSHSSSNNSPITPSQSPTSSSSSSPLPTDSPLPPNNHETVSVPIPIPQSSTASGNSRGNSPPASSSPPPSANMASMSLSRTFSPCGSNSLDDHHSTPLHRAAATGNLECVEVLLENNCPRLQRIMQNLKQTAMKHSVGSHSISGPVTGATGRHQQRANYVLSASSSNGPNGHITPLASELNPAATGCTCSVTGGASNCSCSTHSRKGLACAVVHSAPSYAHMQYQQFKQKHNYPCICRVGIDIGDDRGNTPLLRAAAKGHLLIVKLLIKHGANIRQRDHRQNTVLHHACISGNAELVRCLLEWGVDCSARNADMMTAMDVLHRINNEELFMTMVQSCVVNVVRLVKDTNSNLFNSLATVRRKTNTHFEVNHHLHHQATTQNGNGTIGARVRATGGSTNGSMTTVRPRVGSGNSDTQAGGSSPPSSASRYNGHGSSAPQHDPFHNHHHYHHHITQNHNQYNHSSHNRNNRSGHGSSNTYTPLHRQGGSGSGSSTATSPNTQRGSASSTGASSCSLRQALSFKKTQTTSSTSTPLSSAQVVDAPSSNGASSNSVRRRNTFHHQGGSSSFSDMDQHDTINYFNVEARKDDLVDTDAMNYTDIAFGISSGKMGVTVSPCSLKQLCRQAVTSEKIFIGWQLTENRSPGVGNDTNASSTPTGSVKPGSLHVNTVLAGSATSGLRQLAAGVSASEGSSSEGRGVIERTEEVALGQHIAIDSANSSLDGTGRGGEARTSRYPVANDILEVTAEMTLAAHPELKFIFPFEVLEYVHS